MAEEIAQLEGLSRRLEPLKTVLEPRIPGQSALPFVAVSLVEKGAHWLIQYRHSFIPESEYRTVEAAGFRQAFQPLYPRLPPVEHPTKVDVVFMEDTINPRSKWPFHGLLVAAIGAAAWEALTGEPHLRGILYNRMPYEDTIGPERKALLGPPVPDHLKKDLTEPHFKAWLKGATYHVVSTSTTHSNENIKNPTDREAAEKRLMEYFGENTIFVQSVDNYNVYGPRRHTAYTNHPDTLLVGACQSTPANELPATPRLMHAESYNSYGPDLVCETSPLSAHCLKDMFPGTTTYEAVQGTSFSTAQAAVMVQKLLGRFAVSPENPQSVLTKDDVALALRQTAQPLHVREYESETLKSENNKQLLENVRIGDHYVNKETGCGSIDIGAAWRQLERMEQAVKSGNARVQPRQNPSAALNLQSPDRDADGYYHYQVEMNDALHADVISIDTQVQNHLPDQSPGRMFIKGPQSNQLELFPSDHLQIHYRIARTSAFHGVPLNGTWTLLSTEPLEFAKIRFSKSMAPDHVAVTHKPDEKARFRDLYRQADLKTIPYDELDQRLLHAQTGSAPAIACHDFSATSFPPGYLELRLLQLASDPVHHEHALALAASNHPLFKAQEAILQAAIRKGDTVALFALLAPDENAKIALVEHAFHQRDNKEILAVLAQHGATTITYADGIPFFNRIVLEAQEHILWEHDKQLARLKTVVEVMRQKGQSILQPDAARQTVLDYGVDYDIHNLLQQGVADEKRLAEIKCRDEQFAKIIQEFVDKTGEDTAQRQSLPVTPPQIPQPVIPIKPSVPIGR